MVTYTGGLCGAFILLVFPALLVGYARDSGIEDKLQQENHNRAKGFGKPWIYLTLFWSFLTVLSVVVKVWIGGRAE